MYSINFYNNYLFLKNLNFLNLKFKNPKKTNIIYYQDPLNINYNELNKIHLWCKRKKIKLYIMDNYKLAVKYKANGIYLTVKSKTPIFSKFFKKNFEIIGSAHNQIEYFFKFRQNCNLIMLSPIFYNPKYSRNKILNVHKFNLISKNWTKDLCALGGINLSNIKKIQSTKVKNIAYKRAIKNPPTN
jgi:thiamine-phosphate pyrophosphorylase